MIYLIEDDDSLRQSLHRALESIGYRILEFSCATDFLKQIRRPQSPAVILLDMQMPEMNGLELQERLIAKDISTPIIFISGQSHPQQIIDSLQNGAYQFLLKPFEFKALKTSIAEALAMDGELNTLRTAYQSLTPRETEVFVALAQGRLVKQIALDREVSESVIKLHKSRVMKKLDVKTLQALTGIYLDIARSRVSAALAGNNRVGSLSAGA